MVYYLNQKKKIEFKRSKKLETLLMDNQDLRDQNENLKNFINMRFVFRIEAVFFTVLNLFHD